MSIRWERNEFRSTTCAAVEIRSRLGGRSVAAGTIAKPTCPAPAAGEEIREQLARWLAVPELPGPAELPVQVLLEPPVPEGAQRVAGARPPPARRPGPPRPSSRRQCSSSRLRTCPPIVPATAAAGATAARGTVASSGPIWRWSRYRARSLSQTRPRPAGAASLETCRTARARAAPRSSPGSNRPKRARRTATKARSICP